MVVLVLQITIVRIVHTWQRKVTRMLTKEEFIEMLHDRGLTTDELYQGMKDQHKEEQQRKDENFIKMIEGMRDQE